MPSVAFAAHSEEIRTTPDLRRVYQEHAAFVRTVLARLVGPDADAEDLTHELFLLVMRAPRRLGQVEDLRAWLLTIAFRIARKARRRARLRRFVGLDEAECLPDERRPDAAFENQEACRRVYAALDRLSEKKRTVFILHELQELTGPEIAGLLGCPVRTVWTRLFHARRQFEAELERLRRCERSKESR